MDKLKKNKHLIILFFFSFVILITTLLFINENQCISILGDEFGYWSFPAFIMNKPWHSLASTNSYYGWGYGVLLVPIMFLFDSVPTLMYQVAIFLNAFMLCGILIIVYKCMLLLSEKLSKNQIAMIAGLVSLFPSNMYAVFNTMPELLLQFLYWIMVYLVLLLEREKGEKKRKKLYVLLIVVVTYMFSVHQRAIGLAIDLVICMVVHSIWAKKKKYLDILKNFFLFAGAFILILVIKSQYTKWLYTTPIMNESDTGQIANDFGGFFSDIEKFFSLKAVFSVTISMIGKIYYSNTATFFVLGIGVFVCVKTLLKRKKIIYLFCLLGWLQAVGIAAAFMPAGFETRTDILIYGRYVEYTLGPLVMLGLLCIFEKMLSIKTVFFLLIIQYIVSFITASYIAKESINSNLGNIFTLANIFFENTNREAVFAACLIGTFFFSILFIIGKKGKRSLLYFTIILLCIFELNVFRYNYKKIIIPWQEKVNENVELVEKYKKIRKVDKTIYLYDYGIGGKMFQFLNPNVEGIRVDEIEKILDEALVLSQYNSENLSWISESYNMIYKNDILILWRK